MECIKTGCIAMMNGRKITGDLMYNPVTDEFVLRGIPPAMARDKVDDPRPSHILIDEVQLYQRIDGPWYDAPGVFIRGTSQDFRDHIHKWYPNFIKWVESLGRLEDLPS